MKINKESAMLIDIQYVKNRKEDCIYIIWKDLDSGETHMEYIPEPKMTIYFEKPEFRNHTYNKTYAKIDELNAMTVPYKNIIYAIADDIGPNGIAKIRSCFETQNYKALDDFYCYPYVFGADYDIRAWYRMQWLKKFDNDRDKVLTKGFMDIEVDSLEAIGFPKAEENPIDLITLIDSSTNTSYTFALIGVYYEHNVEALEKRYAAGTFLDGELDYMLRDKIERAKFKNECYKKRKPQQEYWSTHISELEEEAHKLFDENYPGMNYKFFFYEDERKMLVHIFQLINKLKLNMIGIWNIAFDIPYIIDRCKALSLNPVDVMVDKAFPIKECYFKKDNIHFDIKNKADFFKITSYTVFMDQMVTYAAIRKGGPELRRNNLGYIANKEIGDEKLDYTDAGNIKTLSSENYLLYILYNIKDVLLQVGIEQNTTDMDTYWFSTYKNVTPYEDIFKQTKMLRNVQYKSFLEQGLIPGCNVNSINYYKNKAKHEEEGTEEEEHSFEGALVGDPTLIEKFGQKIFGKPSRSMFRYAIDMDMSAFYPSTIQGMNIDPTTLLFKMIVPPTIFDVKGGEYKFNGITDVQLIEKNRDNWTEEDIGGEIMDNFTTGNIISFAHKWLNFPTIDDVVRAIQKGKKDEFT